MNAQEARAKALKITGDSEKKQYSNIKNKIVSAVDSGKLTCNYYIALLPAVKIQLEFEGFKISSFFDQRDGTTITISW